MLAVEVDADVASLLDHCVRHVEEVHRPSRELVMLAKVVGRLMVMMVKVVVVNIRRDKMGRNGDQHHVEKGHMMLVLAVITRRLQQSLLGMAVVMLMMGSSSPVITKLALLVREVDLGSREDLDVSANVLSQFCCQTKKVFHLIFSFSDLV